MDVGALLKENTKREQSLFAKLSDCNFKKAVTLMHNDVGTRHLVVSFIVYCFKHSIYTLQFICNTVNSLHNTTVYSTAMQAMSELVRVATVTGTDVSPVLKLVDSKHELYDKVRLALIPHGSDELLRQYIQSKGCRPYSIFHEASLYGTEVLDRVVRLSIEGGQNVGLLSKYVRRDEVIEEITIAIAKQSDIKKERRIIKDNYDGSSVEIRALQRLRDLKVTTYKWM